LEEGLAIAEEVYASPNPELMREALSESDRSKLDAVTLPKSLEVTSEIISDESSLRAAYSGCWELHADNSVKAAAGNTLYTFWQTTQVCVDNGNVYSVEVSDAGGETSTPGWRIDREPTTRTKNVGWEGRGVARYYFVLGAGGWDISHPVNCLQLRLNANGYNYLLLTSCSLDSKPR
jgi:hypothetical protein